MSTTVAEQVDTAAEAIRAANHAAMSGALAASEAYTVVGGLAELVHRLPQLLDHLARPLRTADPVDYRDDRGSDPIHALRQSRAALDDAREVFEALVRHLERAHNHLGHLGQHDRPGGEHREHHQVPVAGRRSGRAAGHLPLAGLRADDQR